MKIDWRQKYQELRSKYMNAIDMAFKLGYQEGQQAAQFEQAQMQLQQMEEQMAMMQQQTADPMGGGEEMPIDPETGEPLPPEALGEEGMAPAEVDQEMAADGGGDLDQSIEELEGFVKNEPDHAALLKDLHKQRTAEDKPLDKSEKAEKLKDIIEKF